MMRKRTVWIELDASQQRRLTQLLSDSRNRMIQQNQPSEDVSALIYLIAGAPGRRSELIPKENSREER